MKGKLTQNFVTSIVLFCSCLKDKFRKFVAEKSRDDCNLFLQGRVTSGTLRFFFQYRPFQILLITFSLVCEEYSMIISNQSYCLTHNVLALLYTALRD